MPSPNASNKVVSGAAHLTGWTCAFEATKYMAQQGPLGFPAMFQSSTIFVFLWPKCFFFLQ